MGCCTSVDVSSGVGRRNVILLGRRHTGKARLLMALGKNKWDDTSIKKGDKATHNYSGLKIEKLSTDSVPGAYWEEWVTARIADVGADNVTFWYLFDETVQHNIGGAVADLKRLCDKPEFMGIPIWVIIQTKNRKAYERFEHGKLRLYDMLNALQLKDSALGDFRNRVKRVVRITLSDTGYRTLRTDSSSAFAQIDQLTDAIRGGSKTKVDG